MLQELVLFEIKVVSRATAHLELRFAQEGDSSFKSYGSETLGGLVSYGLPQELRLKDPM